MLGARRWAMRTGGPGSDVDPLHTPPCSPLDKASPAPRDLGGLKMSLTWALPWMGA